MAVSSKQIDVFIRVVQLGSVTETALALGLSQPSVSKSLSLLEQQLGFPLFERVGGRMKPTAEASQVYDEALRMQQGIARFDRVVENVRRVGVGQLRVCATPALALNVLPKMAPAVRERFPDHGMVLDMCLNNEIEDAIERRHYDLGFYIRPLGDIPASAQVVCEGRMVCVMPAHHARAGQASIRWTDLDARELIYISTDARLISMMESGIEGFRNRPIAAMETNRYSVAINLVRQGQGVTIVDEFALAGIDRSGLVSLPFEPHLPIAVVASGFASRSLSGPLQACIGSLRELLTAC